MQLDTVIPLFAGLRREEHGTNNSGSFQERSGIHEAGPRELHGHVPFGEGDGQIMLFICGPDRPGESGVAGVCERHIRR